MFQLCRCIVSGSESCHIRTLRTIGITKIFSDFEKPLYYSTTYSRPYNTYKTDINTIYSKVSDSTDRGTLTPHQSFKTWADWDVPVISLVEKRRRKKKDDGRLDPPSSLYNKVRASLWVARGFYIFC